MSKKNHPPEPMRINFNLFPRKKIFTDPAEMNKEIKQDDPFQHKQEVSLNHVETVLFSYEHVEI